MFELTETTEAEAAPALEEGRCHVADLLFKMLKTLNAAEQKHWEDTGIDHHKEIFGKWLALQASA